jgi:hypothetical protein
MIGVGERRPLAPSLTLDTIGQHFARFDLDQTSQ